MTSKSAVNATTVPVAPRRKPREHGLIGVKLALLHLHTMALEGAGSDPYNSREGNTRSDAWAGSKPR